MVSVWFHLIYGLNTHQRHNTHSTRTHTHHIFNSIWTIINFYQNKYADLFHHTHHKIYIIEIYICLRWMARAIECALARYMLIGIFIGLNLSVLMEIKDARKEIECVVIKHIYTYKRYGNYQTIVCEVMYFSFLFCSLFFICRFLRRCSWKIVYSIGNNDFNIYIYMHVRHDRN